MKIGNQKKAIITLFFLSCLIALVLSEIILRIFFPYPEGILGYIPDGHVMQRPATNKNYNFELGKNVFSINNLGFRRNNDTQYLKPADTFRVVVLGGSAVFAGWVDYFHSWVFLIEKKLRNKFKNIKIEVINAGVAGYSSFDSEINYLYIIRRMSPDAVMVYHTWNDMKYFRPIEAGAMLRVAPYRKHPPNLLSLRTLMFYLRKLELYLRMRALYWKVLEASAKMKENKYSFLGHVTSIKDGGHAHQWEYNNFNDLALVLKSDGVLPIFVTQGSLLSESNIDNPKIRDLIGVQHQGLTHRQVLTQWKAISKIITDVSHKHHIFLIDAHSQVPHSLKYFKDHVHLNESGNQKLADIIFEALINNEQFTSLITKYRSSGI